MASYNTQVLGSSFYNEDCCSRHGTNLYHLIALQSTFCDGKIAGQRTAVRRMGNGVGHPTHPTASSLKCTRRECERPNHMVAGKFAQQLYRLKKCGSATIHSPIPNLLHIRSRTVQIETMRFCNDPSKFPHMFPSSTILTLFV